MRFKSDCIVQTGKTLREEPEAFSAPNLPYYGVNQQDFNVFLPKDVAVITKKASA
jgi:hypothetical protein